jgi:L-ascorbate metabolism protein UlaG (beta-lactamase superfamily)
MELTWFGTAGFKIESSAHTLLIDPYLPATEAPFQNNL